MSSQSVDSEQHHGTGSPAAPDVKDRAPRSTPPTVRPLTSSDVPAFLALIEALADYEGLPPPDIEARDRLARHVLAENPPFRVLLAEYAGRVIGYAVFFETYSTFLGRPTLYVEDIFVLPEARRHGAGRALMQEMAREAVRRGCGRMEWQVLAWNAPAIAFYDRLGASLLDNWRVCRLAADGLARLAEGRELPPRSRP